MIGHVLLTGGAGFLGSHLARALARGGSPVSVLDDLSAPRGAPLPAGPCCRLTVADVRDGAALSAAAAGADVIVHLASVVGVDAVIADPRRTGSVIREGTARALQVARTRGCPLVFFSTSEVTDAARSGPRAVYGEAKRDAEDLLLSHAHELPVTIVRPFNIVGPGQAAPGMVLPALATAARTGAPLMVHGDGTQERAFLHVDDLVSATLSLLERPAPPGGRVVEVGAEERVPIGELAGRLSALAGRDAPVMRGAAGGRREDRPRRSADLASLRRQIAFRPRWSLDAILRQAVGRA